MRYLSKKYKKLLVIALVFVAIIGVAHRATIFEIINEHVNTIQTITKPIANLASPDCQQMSSRPVGVMISSDAIARPLSGIGQADMVFEMPVTDGGITRMMAVYICHQPNEIGSIRSSRLDFIPIAQGLGTIYAHWGGEHQALAELNSGVIDNIDGLVYDGTIYFRKKNIKPPQNGFTSFSNLEAAIGQRHYAMVTDAKAYTYTARDASLDTQSPPSVYADILQVQWNYSPASNSYARVRGGKPEIDHNTNSQVQAKNVVIMHTTWSPISKDYIRVQTLGTGQAQVYQNGTVIQGTWTKAKAEDKLVFSDTKGQEIPFVSGPVWVEITTASASASVPPSSSPSTSH